MVEGYPSINDYLCRGEYKRLRVQGSPIVLSDLELAIIGYILISPERRTDKVKMPPQSKAYSLPNPAHTIPYSELHRLVFEYLKINDGVIEIKRIISETIERLKGRVKYWNRFIEGGWSANADNIRRGVERQLSSFEGISQKTLSEINYEEFHPPELSRQFLTDGASSIKRRTPFAEYCLKQIKRLIEYGILLEYYDMSDHKRAYLALNPTLRISETNS